MFRHLRWIALGVGLLFLLLAVALGVYTNTEHFRRLVRDQLLDVINHSIRGSISLDRVEGSVWGNITLHDVRLRHQDSEIVRVPRLKLAYALLPLLRGQLQIVRAEAAQPSAQIERDAQGRWNIAEALASNGETGSQFAVVLKALVLRQGNVDLRVAGAEPQEYRLREVLLDGKLAIRAAGLEFEASQVSARMQSAALPEVALKGALSFNEAGSTSTVNARELLLETAASRLKLDGELTGFDKSKIAAKLAIEKLAAADLIRFVPEWSTEHDLAGTITAKGPFDALAVELALTSGGAKAMSNFTVDVAAPAPRFRGTVKVTGFNPRTLFATKKFAGVLEGEAALEGNGFALSELNGSGSFKIRAAEVQGWTLGDVRLKTSLRKNTALLSGDLKSALGGADWRGQVTLGKVPKYDFALAVSNLDVNKVSPETKALSGVLSFKGTVKGSGITIAEMNTQANLQVLPSTFGPVQLRKGELVAAVVDGKLRITRGSLSSADSTLAVTGDIGLDLEQRGKLDYEFRTENLSPWLTLAERKGTGSLALAGNVQGSLDELMTRGRVKLSRLKLDGVAIDNGEVDFALTRKRNQVVPDGVLTVRFADITAGAALRKLDAKVNLVSSPSQSAQIEATAEDQFSRFHAVKATVHYGEAEIVANLSQLTLGLPGGSWNLTQPTVLRKRGESFSVQNFTLRSGERNATLDGYVSLTGEQALSLTITNFPLEGLAPLLPKQPTMTGLLALQAKVGGTAAAPEINGAINLINSTIGGQSYAGLTADFGYKARRATLSVTLRQDSAHSLTATGTLPLLLSWHDNWRSQVIGDMDLRVKSSGLSLAFLNAYTGKTVTDLSGEISVDFNARGAVSEPTLSGTFRLTDGKLKATLLNVEATGITVDGAFDKRAITIKNLALRAKDGRLDGNGSMLLKNYQIENFKLSLAARRWPAINTRRYQAEVDGNIDVEGPLAAPKLSGQIAITDANIRPDLTFLERSSTSVQRDGTIVVMSRAGTQNRAATEKNRNNGFGDSELFKNFTVDLTVSVPSNVWIRHPDAVAELRGKIHATKKSGQSLQLVGTSEIIRGWAAFQGRRFNFERGEIRFVGGGSIDPTLDIIARHRLPQYTVDAVVGGTVAKPSLSLRSDPSLDQTDILALLLFGKPTKDLNRGEEASLKQNALDVTGGFAAARIGSAVAEAIGLDKIGLGEIDFNGGRVGFGRYIGGQTYVTVGQELAGERGQEVTVEYQLAPDWKIESSTTSKGASEVDLIWQKRY